MYLPVTTACSESRWATSPCFKLSWGVEVIYVKVYICVYISGDRALQRKAPQGVCPQALEAPVLLASRPMCTPRAFPAP